MDAVEFGDLRAGEETCGLKAGAMEPAGTEVIVPPLEHGVGELDRQYLVEQREILLNKLLLEIDGVGGDHSLLAPRDGEEEGGDEISETLADAGTGFDDQVATGLEGAGDG